MRPLSRFVPALPALVITVALALGAGAAPLDPAPVAAAPSARPR